MEDFGYAFLTSLSDNNILGYDTPENIIFGVRRTDTFSKRGNPPLSHLKS